MNQWAIKDPWVFFGVGGMVVVYVLYMMIRRHKGERAGRSGQDPEL
jgi:hypothetical protein